MPLVYWRFIKPSTANVETTLSFYMLYKLLIIRDFIDLPTNSSVKNKETALHYLNDIAPGEQIVNTLALHKRVMPAITQDAQQLSQMQKDDQFIQSLNQNRLITEQMSAIHPFLPTYCLSYLGFIPGNKVELISKNSRSEARINWFNQRVIFNGGKLNWEAPYMTMPLSPDQPGHIAFQEDPVFIKIRDMITKAEHSIFIDIFLFGGTMGATLARYLVEQTLLKIERNPEFKTLIVHDYATNYNMWPEMQPLFDYLKDAIKTNSQLHDHFYLLQANIQRHPPGIPFGLTNLVPKTEAVFKEMEKRGTYYESKIDHSKVIVIDANTDHPAAYFGSKNWTDHSGGYYYDNVIYVEGPAAAVVQASYYDDVAAALTTDLEEQKWFYYKDQGFDNRQYLNTREHILDWMKIKRDTYPAQGDQTIRFAEANVDGRIKNVRNILIDMIKSASVTIYMEQLFFYDKYIVDALIKRKIEAPTLDVKILADHNGNFGMNGFPNTIFMQELLASGIEIRARRTIGLTATFPNGKQQEYHQENHRKITSIDGTVMLGGSSNMNPDTLQGSFREFGAQLFDRQVIAQFDKDFLQDWNDESKVDKHAFFATPAQQNVDSPPLVRSLKLGKTLLTPDFSAVIYNLARQIVRAKDHLEERY